MNIPDFAQHLINYGYDNVSIVIEESDGGGNVTFENPQGSSFDLWMDSDGNLESGTCISVAIGDQLDFDGLHMEAGQNMEEFPFNDLLNW